MNGTVADTPRARPGSARRRSKPEADMAEVNLGPLEDYIGFHLRRAQDTAVRAFVAASGEQNFKPGRFATLMVIRLNPGLSQTAVCRAIGRDKSTISPLLRDLEHERLIERAPSVRDRRSVMLRLTPEGEAALDQLIVHVQAHDARLDALVGAAKPELIGLLKMISTGLGG